MTLNNVAKMNLKYIMIVVAIIMMLPLVYRLFEAYEDRKTPKGRKALIKEAEAGAAGAKAALALLGIKEKYVMM
jgi:hypothetical protein